MNLLVRNLSEKITEARLVSIFQPFGEVRSATIVTDQATGRSRGFGFVEMPNQAEAEAAIKALHHKNIEHQKIRVKEANPKYGPEYFAAGNVPETQVKQIVPSPAAHPAPRKREGREGYRKKYSRFPQREGREFPPRGERGGYGRPRPFERGGQPFSRPPEREGGRQEFRPRGGYGPRRPGEQGYGRPRPFERGGRPNERFPKREGFPPRSERGYGAPRHGERGQKPYSRPGQEGGARQGFPGRGEGGYGRPRPFERGNKPYGRPPEHGGGRREFPTRGGYGPRRPGEGGGRPRPQFGHEGERQGFQPRGGRPFGPRHAGEHGHRPQGREGSWRKFPGRGERRGPSRGGRGGPAPRS